MGPFIIRRGYFLQKIQYSKQVLRPVIPKADSLPRGGNRKYLQSCDTRPLRGMKGNINDKTKPGEDKGTKNSLAVGRHPH